MQRVYVSTPILRLKEPPKPQQEMRRVKFVSADGSAVTESGNGVVFKSNQTRRFKVGDKVSWRQGIDVSLLSTNFLVGDVGAVVGLNNITRPRVFVTAADGGCRRSGWCEWYAEEVLELVGRNLTHVVRPSLTNVKEAEIVFEIAFEPGTQPGRSGIWFGVTTCEHDVTKGASGSPNSFMYHCKDGHKVIDGQAPEAHALHATCSSTGYYKDTFASCNIIILKFSQAAAQDNSEARGTLTVYDIDNNGCARQCGPGPLAVCLPDDKELFFCCETFAQGQGATILSMEVDG